MGSSQGAEVMTLQNWNGARWWKCDLHAHTPASYDYGMGPCQTILRQCTPRDWLLGYMRAGIDCVAVTDHDCGDWIDFLQNALADLEQDRPAEFRPLYLFPGIEITVHGNVHLLAILPSNKTEADINNLLGAVGSSNAHRVTTKPFEKVVEEIERAGGIAVPAHSDKEKGLLTTFSGDTLKQALRCGRIFAMEIVDSDFEKPQLYHDKNLHWTEILGSDSHHPSGKPGGCFPGSHFTWVKMGSLNLDGLRLALMDGDLSVRRPDEHPDPTNRHAEYLLGSLEVAHTRYMGRESPFVTSFNPWLNAIVGGRGTGKSSLIEFLRIALRREDELPDELKPEFDKYANVYQTRDGDGLLTDEAKICVTYSKYGSEFRIQWDRDGNSSAIEQKTADGGWSQAEGDVIHRFPVRMYSQKQIFHLAKVPSALLSIVDDASDVDHQSWSSRWRKEENRFLSLRLRVREIEAELKEKTRLGGELDDVKRKLAIFEKSGHANVLRSYQYHRRQQRVIEIWQEQWADAGERVRQAGTDFVPDALEVIYIDAEAQADSSLLANAKTVRERLEAIRQQLEQIATGADKMLAEWRKTLEQSAWRQAATSADDAYESLSKQLAKEGVSDPKDYGSHVQRRQLIEQDLDKLESLKKEVKSLRVQTDASRTRLLKIRQELTETRRLFLKDVLMDNPYVRIRVVPYGEQETVETKFRRLIQRDDGSFERDIRSLLEPLESFQEAKSSATQIETALEQVKQGVRAIIDGSRRPQDTRFKSHLSKLQSEVFDRLDTWFPEDSLDVQYSPKGDGRTFRPISAGSPGQKTAALLAFLLSYGCEPLVLDQPEDDLDNRLIHELIVKQIREEKQKRQIIVVTHNPNIVVNGDAELVIALGAKNGRTQKECVGSLQERKVRETICTIMEGGLEAFKERYHRITMGVPDA